MLLIKNDVNYHTDFKILSLTCHGTLKKAPWFISHQPKQLACACLIKDDQDCLNKKPKKGTIQLASPHVQQHYYGCLTTTGRYA